MFVGSRVPERQLAAWRRKEEEEEEEEEGWAGASTKVRWLSAATVGAWCPDDEAGSSAGLARGVPNQGFKLRPKQKEHTAEPKVRGNK